MLDRWVNFRLRSVLAILVVVLVAWALLKVIAIASQVLTWMGIALFLALALNPFVELLMRRGVRRRGAAVAISVVLVLVGVALVGWLFIPTLVDQVNNFIRNVPDYVDDLTKGRGKLGFLETKYHIVEHVKKLTQGDAAKKLFGFSGTAIAVTKSVVTIVLGVLTIFVMTIFMLLEGPAWMERFYGLLPQESQSRWRRVGRDVYLTVGGYVSGNLLISLIAGVSTTVVLLIMGVPFAVALGLLVALLDLIPLAGATIAAVVVVAVSALHSTTAAIVVGIFMVFYQQVENHFLQPVIYGRTVQLSPLAVLVAVLIGAQLAGVVGALAAIPVAGSLQVIILDVLRARRERLTAAVTAAPSD